jgi:hypothetical protein
MLNCKNWLLSSTSGQEIPRHLLNQKVDYRVHKSPPPVPILNHRNPVHTLTPYYSKIHINIIHP